MGSLIHCIILIVAVTNKILKFLYENYEEFLGREGAGKETE